MMLLVLPAFAMADVLGEEQDFVAMNGEWEIHGTIRFPVDYVAGEKYPVAILSHGIIDDRNQSGMFVQLADALDDVGIISVRFDFGGYGESTMPLTLNSLLTEEADIKAVMSYVNDQSFTDTSKVNLMGFSMGGAATSLAAGSVIEGINCVCLWAPAAVIVDDSKEGRIVNAQVDVSDIPDEIPVFEGRYVFGKAFIEDSIDLDIYGIAQNYEGPVLILQGDADWLVPMAYSERYDEVYKASELIVIKDGGHVFSGDNLQEVISLTVNFLVEKCAD